MMIMMIFSNKILLKKFLSFTQLMECLLEIYVWKTSIEIQRGNISFVYSFLLALLYLPFFLPNSFG